MQIYILDAEYNSVGMIDESESVLWRKRYNDAGECEIYLPCDDAHLGILRRGHYLYRYDDDMFCKVETVEIETDVETGDYIIATARDICTILSGRIVRWQTVYSGTVAGFIERLLIDNATRPTYPADITLADGTVKKKGDLHEQRQIANLEIDTSNFAELTDPIEVSAFTDDLLQRIVATCKAYGYGFRVSFNMETHTLSFRLYKGKNKSDPTGEEYVEFSPEYANILASHYAEDESNYKNLAYVGYKGTDEQTHLLSYYNGDKEPTGEERREIYIDGTGTSRDITYDELAQMFPSVTKNGNQYTAGGVVVATSEGTGDDEKITVSDSTYLLLIRALGVNALADHARTREFTGSVDTIDTYEYKTDYDLGDIVNVANDYGISTPAQIVDILESDDNEDGHMVEPTFEYLN